MKLGIHEACELNELLMSCTNSIHSMALFANQAQDPELKDMILRHFSVHVQDYNMKVEFATQTTGSQDHLNVPPLQMLPMGAPVSIQPVQPQVQLTQLDDRAIATSYLLTLKRSGRDYAWATFECTVPQLRSFLENAFRMCSHQSFEVWSYMVKKGWYPAIPAPADAMNAMGQTYQKVQTHEPMAVYS